MIINRKNLLEAATLIHSKDKESIYLGCNMASCITGADDIQTWYESHIPLFATERAALENPWFENIALQYFGYVRSYVEKKFKLLIVYSPYIKGYKILL